MALGYWGMTVTDPSLVGTTAPFKVEAIKVSNEVLPAGALARIWNTRFSRSPLSTVEKLSIDTEIVFGLLA